MPSDPSTPLGPLDPQAAAVIAGMPRLWHDMAAMTPAKARAFAEGNGEPARVPPGVVRESLEFPGAAGTLTARAYRPDDADPAGAILWIRGGGFLMGSPATERGHGDLARASGCVVVSVDYRLAPEHPFPAAPEDCYAAACWLADHTDALGVPRGAVAVGGESAGGNLAAAVTLMARDRGGPAIPFQLLLYPMTARTFPGGSRHDPAVSPIAPPEAIEWLWRQYVGDAEDVDPLASPLDAPSLAGLPPALVVTAEYDLLRDEGEAYAERLAQAGVPVETRRYDGVHHGFAELSGQVAAADACIAFMGERLRAALLGE